MSSATFPTSSHAVLACLAAHGVDRVFLVPGESYLGILDALNDFPRLDVVTCRHEAGAGFMAVADGRLARRPGVLMVSRGPGASNAAIAIHTAQQDAVPLIVLVGQVPRASLRRGAFQEIDYQHMYGRIAKWVSEPTDPAQLPEVAFKAVRMATSGIPGPVVIVLPEDIQQQPVPYCEWHPAMVEPVVPPQSSLARLTALIRDARRPLIVAGGGFAVPGGRESLLALAEASGIPVVVSFRRHDVFPNAHPLYAGDLGLKITDAQMAAFHDSDLILALGTRFGDLTSQGYRFPRFPQPVQTFVHCHASAECIGQNYAVDFGLACDPVLLARELVAHLGAGHRPDAGWAGRLRGLYEGLAAWPAAPAQGRPVDFTQVVKVLAEHAPGDTWISLDAGAFGAPFYRHFPFDGERRLLAPLSGAMGFGVPAAVAAQLREPRSKVICAVGDGGFMMTGNEMIAAVERSLPILFLLSNNGGYGSIRNHQDRHYPGRHAGTTLVNPDFTAIAQAFGIEAECVTRPADVEDAVRRGLRSTAPAFIEFRTGLGLGA